MRCNSVCAVLGALALCASAQAQQPSTYDVTIVAKTDLDRSGTPLTTLEDLNDKAEIVGNTRGPDNTQVAFVWHDGAVRELNPLLSADFAYAGAINNDSDILGNFRDGPNQLRAFLLRGTRIVPIPTAADESMRQVIDLNNRRQAVIDVLVDTFNRYYIWRRGQRTPLEPFPGTLFAFPARISDRGVVVGTAFTTDRGEFAVVWQDGTIMEIEQPPGALAARGVDIDNRGLVLAEVAFSSEEGGWPYLWNEGTITELRPLPGNLVAISADLNNRRAVVGTTIDEQGPHRGVATLWRRGLATDLNALIAADDPLQPFIHLEAGLLINDRGQIVAFGRDLRDPERVVAYYYLLTPRP
jgi:uncharacterized membrane protein